MRKTAVGRKAMAKSTRSKVSSIKKKHEACMAKSGPSVIQCIENVKEDINSEKNCDIRGKKAVEVC